ncbi:electron transfer flavoprotein subunit alpha, partial [Thalassospira xiamenensis]
MSILVIAEHDNQELNPATLKTLAAAQQLGDNISVLVAGENCAGVANAAAQAAPVKKVLLADNAAYGHFLAENLAELVAKIAADYDYVIAPATTTGKNFMPRVAALLDVNQISDIISVESADTFKRPIYAGNAIATVQSSDAKKVITVRTTAFDAVAAEGADAG